MEVPTQGLAQDFEKVIRDYGRENVPAAIKVRAAELGLMGGKQSKVFTVNDAEDWLQAINRLYDPMKRAQASALDQLRTAVKNAVLSADDQGGVYAAARTAAAKRFQLHDMVPALKAAAQGTIEPDDFVRRFLVNGKTDDVKALAQVFTKEDPGALLEARKQIGAQLLRAAFGENPAGDQLFRPTQYAKLLRQIGDEKLGALFSYEEIAQMKALGRVGAYANSIPTAAPVNTSNNAGYVLSLFSRVPGVPLVASMLSAGSKTLANQRTVKAAMAAQVPQAEIPPGVQRRLGQVLVPGSFGAGSATARKAYQDNRTR